MVKMYAKTEDTNIKPYRCNESRQLNDCAPKLSEELCEIHREPRESHQSGSNDNVNLAEDKKVIDNDKDKLSYSVTQIYAAKNNINIQNYERNTP